jgi:hypothetical protein
VAPALAPAYTTNLWPEKKKKERKKERKNPDPEEKKEKQLFKPQFLPRIPQNPSVSPQGI